MKSTVYILMGLLLLIVSIYFIGNNFWNFREAVIVLFKGGLISVVFLIGILLVTLGIFDLKE